MIARHVQTIFCDDIRHEMGGKVSYIGVYSGGLFVPSFPVILPKLCLSVKVVTSADEPLNTLTLRVLKDDETLQKIVLDERQLAAASESPEEMSDEDLVERIHVAQFMLVFSPLQLDGPCVLRVRVQTEDGELWGVALKVGKAPLPHGLPPDQSG